MNPDKPVQADNVPTSPAHPRRQVPREEIVRRAEQIWRERGEPTGKDEAIWLEAESQLQAQAEARPVAGTDSRPPANAPAAPARSQTKSRDPAEAAAPTRSPTETKPKRTNGKLRNQ